jgi:putative transposase
MFKAYKYRIKPNQEQIQLIESSFGCARFVYNYFLELKTEMYVNGKQKLTKFEMDAKLKELKEEHHWLTNVNSQALQAVTANLDSAFSRFFKEKKGFPKFKSKKFSKSSFMNPQSCVVDFELNTISIPKAKNIKAVLHRHFEGKVKSITISKSSTGKYYASILVEIDENIPAKPELNKDRAIGVDLGLTHFVITSEGDKINNPRFLKKSEEKLKRMQRRFSRMNKGSNNQNKQRVKLAKLHEKVSNQRKDFLHKISHELVNENQIDVLCIEDLNTQGMIRNHRLAKSISDVGWGMFRSFLEYKCEWNGKWLLDIGRFEPSSKTCSICGYVNRELTLKDRVWQCPCGVTHDRDINAAINIKEMAFNRQNLMRFIGLEQAESTPVELLGC